MPAARADHAATDLTALPFISDDDCMLRLAVVVATHDSDDLDELAALIGRLAVPIEL
jgi:hypothetical protein